MANIPLKTVTFFYARTRVEVTMVEHFGCFDGNITAVGVEGFAWYRHEQTVEARWHWPRIRGARPPNGGEVFNRSYFNTGGHDLEDADIVAIQAELTRQGARYN